MGLLLEGEHQMGELGDDRFIGVEIRIGGREDETEIEDEFIAWVCRGSGTDRVAQDAIGRR